MVVLEHSAEPSRRLRTVNRTQRKTDNRSSRRERHVEAKDYSTHAHVSRSLSVRDSQQTNVLDFEGSILRSRKASVKVGIVAGRIVWKVCLLTIDALSTFMPFGSLIQAIKDSITSTFKLLKANDSMAYNLTKSLDDSKAVIDEMARHLRREATVSFQKQVLGFLDHVDNVYERCEKWSKKSLMKKVWSSQAYSHEFQALKDKLEFYRQNTLMLYVLQNAHCGIGKAIPRSTSRRTSSHQRNKNESS